MGVRLSTRTSASRADENRFPVFFQNPFIFCPSMQFRKLGFVNFFHFTIAVVIRVYTIAETLVIIMNKL